MRHRPNKKPDKEAAKSERGHKDVAPIQSEAFRKGTDMAQERELRSECTVCTQDRHHGKDARVDTVFCRTQKTRKQNEVRSLTKD
jgi:hypothetical protein